MPQASVEHFHISPRNVRRFDPSIFAKDENIIEHAREMGFGFKNRGVIHDMASVYAADSIQANVTTSTIPGIVQFLQNWLPGQVFNMTAALKIDDFIGISTIGSWEDEQVVQEMLENTGYAVPYNDITNVPLFDWNLTFNPRTVIRFEAGMRVGNLEEARAARVRVNSGDAKRKSCGRSLEISRNLIGFNGYNSGNNNTYGFLNDPGLAGYTSVAGTGTSSSTYWSQKTFLEIQSDILIAINALVTKAAGNIEAEKTDLTLAVPTNAESYLNTTTDFGVSVRDWLKKCYPRLRVVHAVQLNTANGATPGGGAFFLYADEVDDFSTDDRRTWMQIVPAKFIVNGVVKIAKGYEEAYANATAGSMLKRPWAVVQYSGVS